MGRNKRQYYHGIILYRALRRPINAVRSLRFAPKASVKYCKNNIFGEKCFELQLSESRGMTVYNMYIYICTMCFARIKMCCVREFENRSGKENADKAAMIIIWFS